MPMATVSPMRRKPNWGPIRIAPPRFRDRGAPCWTNSDGDVQAKTPRTIKPPAGETYHAIETPRGELGLYLVSDGSETPYRLKIRGPSFQNLSILPELLPGWKVADMIAILGTTDVVMGEVDR